MPDPSLPDPFDNPPDQRVKPRYRVKWNTVAVLQEHGRHLAVVRDISIQGATLYLERNLHGTRMISLHIHVPASGKGDAARVIEIVGKIISCVHDSDHRLFRSGIAFERYARESDRDFLDLRLAQHHSRINENY